MTNLAAERYHVSCTMIAKIFFYFNTPSLLFLALFVPFDEVPFLLNHQKKKFFVYTNFLSIMSKMIDVRNKMQKIQFFIYLTPRLGPM